MSDKITIKLDALKLKYEPETPDHPGILTIRCGKQKLKLSTGTLEFFGKLPWKVEK